MKRFVASILILIWFCASVHAAKKVEFDANGIFLVDAKPFFPIGIIVNEATGGTLNECRSKGFNTLVAGSSMPPSFNPGDLPAISRSGMMVVPIFSDEWIRAAANYPMLLAWSVTDDPELRMIGADQVQRTYATLKAKDPNHPAGLSISTAGALTTYKKGIDFTETEVLPITMLRDVPIKEIGTRIDEARKAQDKTNWPVVPFIQIAGAAQQGAGNMTIQPLPGNNVTYQGNPPRAGAAPGGVIPPPTPLPNATDNRNLVQPEPEEVRCMTYLALVHRASGLFYYAYSTDYPKTWSAMARLNAEVKKLEPWLVADGTEAKCSATNPAIELRGKKVENGWLIIAVNNFANPIESMLTIEGLGDEKLTTMDGRAIQATTDQLPARFQPLEVKVAISGKPPTYAHPGASTTAAPATPPTHITPHR